MFISSVCGPGQLLLRGQLKSWTCLLDEGYHHIGGGRGPPPVGCLLLPAFLVLGRGWVDLLASPGPSGTARHAGRGGEGRQWKRRLLSCFNDCIENAISTGAFVTIITYLSHLLCSNQNISFDKTGTEWIHLEYQAQTNSYFKVEPHFIVVSCVWSCCCGFFSIL